MVCCKLSRLDHHKISKIIQEEGIIVLEDFAIKMSYYL